MHINSVELGVEKGEVIFTILQRCQEKEKIIFQEFRMC